MNQLQAELEKSEKCSQVLLIYEDCTVEKKF